VFKRAASILEADSAGTYQAANAVAGCVQRRFLGTVRRSAYRLYAIAHHIEGARRQLCRWLG
ncbi:MAG: hypothetical protein ACJ0UT_07895, partial [Candidatus Latescibacterota bacterium]